MRNKFFVGFFSFFMSAAVHALFLFVIFSDFHTLRAQSEAREQHIIKVELVLISPAHQAKSENLSDIKELNPEPAELPKPIPKIEQTEPKKPKKTIVPKEKSKPQRKITQDPPKQNQEQQSLSSAKQRIESPSENITPGGSRNDVTDNSKSPVNAVASLSDVKILSRTKPIYPAISRKRKEEGTVILLVRIECGRVLKVSIEKSSGVKTLDSSAAKAIESWKFSSDTDATVRVPVSFSLKD